MKRLIATVLFALTLADSRATETINPNSLVITDMRVAEEGYGLPTIVGIATNQSGGALSNAFIKFNLLDARGHLVGNTIAQASNLETDNAWRFSAPIATPGVVSFKVVEVNAYRD